jgi:hypothetical protein
MTHLPVPLKYPPVRHPGARYIPECRQAVGPEGSRGGRGLLGRRPQRLSPKPMSNLSRDLVHSPEWLCRVPLSAKLTLG